MNASDKIARAKTRLLIRQPFFGSCALSLAFVESQEIETMATDGRSIFYSADFIDEHTEEEIRGVIAHEVLHVVFKHMLRRGERDKDRWNVACDYAINDIILSAQEKDKNGDYAPAFVLPEGGLHDKQYADLSAEAIYDRLPANASDNAAGWGMVLDMTNPDGSELSDAEKKMAEADVEQKVFIAAASAKAVGKLPAQIEQLVERMKRSQVDWRDVLRRFVGGDQPDDYSWSRPHRKAYHQYQMVMPSVDKIGTGDVVIAIDTSASVSANELAHFLGEMNAISDELSPRSITVIACDTEVQYTKTYEQGEVIDNFSAKGRGGTRVRPVFNYIAEHQLAVDNLVYLSDLEVSDYPNDAPDYPVLWVGTNDRTPEAPFGETTYLQMEV